MRRPLLALLTSALAAPLVTGSPAHAAAKKKVATRTYKGPIIVMRWGPVQAEIIVKGKKLKDVKIGVAPENERSAFIDEQAGPLLRKEALKAQTAHIDLISGATLTSAAFVQSLQGALKKAHLPTGAKR